MTGFQLSTVGSSSRVVERAVDRPKPWERGAA